MSTETASGETETTMRGAGDAMDDAVAAVPLDATAFRGLVYEKAAACWRDLPWRRDADPYAIMVSEMMLQQTQVPRVAPKFLSWMGRFPDIGSLAAATVDEVLSYWSGLGYNRRALALHRSGQIIVSDFGGEVPQDETTLRSLPGIGVYTSRAILAFAFDRPTVFLETNIRTVLLKHFFPEETGVSDRALEGIAAQVLDAAAPRLWYTALMDYGSELKRVEGNHSARGAAYKKQAPFATSFRRVRGAVLKRLVEGKKVPIDELYASLPFSRETIERCASALVKEGFAAYEGDSLKISG
ncbi:MAG TPA: A/G-specific adenine glycosylase [Rectinemataceae bacterium]|nr:A/G-specific adenine glycosylase [Rectinemataceae bacterium]